jgi:preprotein translocase SecE subunit
MAVAVKNAPVAAPSKLLDRLPVVALVGAVYVLGSLAVVLWAVPELWYALTQFPRDSATGVVLLALIDTAVAAGLGYVGYRLVRARELPPGARAGAALAVVGILAVLLLTRWVSMWLEYWVYNNRLFGDSGPTAGLALTGAAFVVLLALGGWLFTRPRTVAFLKAVEGQGWFSAKGYKPLQGQRVRRGTIVGLLLIAGTGVWTLMTNGPMRNVTEKDSWALNVPFSGQTVVTRPGDAVVALKDVPAADVWVLSAGDSGLPEHAPVPQQQFREALARLAAEDKELSDNASFDPKELKGEIEKAPVATLAYLADEDTTQLSEAGRPQLALLADVLRERADLTDAQLRQRGLKRLPPAALRLDPLTVRKVNDQLAKEYVKVVNPNDSAAYSDEIRRDAVVSREKFEKAVAETKKHDGTPATSVAPEPAAGDTAYRTIPLLPALAYTVPILLLGAAVWFSWRAVNLPAFADFLIATEAELNKVSWTTRPRLIQDTIVVLVTVFLMAGYLFLMDQTWRFVLSLPFVKVLQFPEETSDKNKSIEDKPY